MKVANPKGTSAFLGGESPFAVVSKNQLFPKCILAVEDIVNRVNLAAKLIDLLCGALRQKGRMLNTLHIPAIP
ncbi:MAG: hypothetical protein LBF84_04200 [Holosporales bacterium]|nr:hypothetical protein [Holosporales bacterium]